MEGAGPKGSLICPGGEVDVVLEEGAWDTSERAPQTRHVGCSQSRRNICSTNGAENNQKRELNRADTPAAEVTAEKSGVAGGGQHSDKRADGDSTASFSSKNLDVCVVQLRNSDFHSPRQLTSSSLGRYVTASDSRLPRGESDAAPPSVATDYNGKNSEKRLTGDGRQKILGHKIAHSYDEKKCDKSGTRNRNLSTRETQRGRSSRENSHHSAVAQLVSSKDSSSWPLLMAEPLPATRRGKGRSSPGSTTNTGSDRLLISASERVTQQPRNVCTGKRSREKNTVLINNIRRCALVERGTRRAGVAARTRGNDERQFLPLRAPPAWQSCARHGRSSESRDTGNIIEKTLKSPHHTATVRPVATDESTYTSEDQRSFTDGETYSEASADGFPWVDYCMGVEKTLLENEKRSESCHSTGESTELKARMSPHKQAQRLGRQRGEKVSMGRTHREGPHKMANCGCDGSEADAERPAQRGDSVRDECVMQKMCFNESGSTSRLASDSTALRAASAAKTEREHQSRNSWADTLRRKASLSFSRSLFREDESRCEHRRPTGMPRNRARKVSQTLRRKMGEAINRLRCKGTATSAKRKPVMWCLHCNRELSPASLFHTECRCHEGSQRFDTHRHYGIDRRVISHLNGHIQRQKGTIRHKRESRDSDTADLEAPILPNKIKLSQKRNNDIRPSPSTAACSRAPADLKKSPLQLPCYSPLRSAPLEVRLKALDTNDSSNRSESFSISYASDPDESDVRDSLSGSQCKRSPVEGENLTRLDAAFAATTLRTSAVGSEMQFEITQQQEGKQLLREKSPQAGQNFAQAPHTSELKKTCPGSRVEKSRTDGSFSRRLSDVMTQASSEPLRCCTDNSENENACHSGYLSPEGDSSSQMSPNAHMGGDCLAPISRSRSLDTAKMTRGKSQCQTKYNDRAENSAITLSDIDASIEWIIEASANPNLLRAAKELLLRKEEAERLGARRCYHCRSLCHLDYKSDYDSCNGSPTRGSSKPDISSLKQLAQVTYLEGSRSDGASSKPFSFDTQPFSGKSIRAARRGRRFERNGGAPWISLNEMRIARTRGSSRHTNKKEALTWTTNSELDSQIEMLRWRTDSRHRDHARAYAQNDVRKIFLCYAPSDVAWNMDQLI